MTKINITQQLMQMIDMVFFACGNLFLFDIVNEMGHQMRWNRYQKMLVDFLWIIFCGIVFCFVLIWNSGGLLRNYIVLGLLIGASVYCYFIRQHCRNCCKWIARWMLRLFRGINKVLLFPFHFFYRRIGMRIRKKIRLIKQRKIDATQEDDILLDETI